MPIILSKLNRHRSTLASEDAALLQSMVVNRSKRWDQSSTAFYQFRVPRQRPGLERYSHTPGLHSPLFETSYAPTDHDVLHNVSDDNAPTRLAVVRSTAAQWFGIFFSQTKAFNAQ